MFLIDLHLCAYAMARLWPSPMPLLRPAVPRKFSLGGPALQRCVQSRGFRTLGIETSCDDTCVAILRTKEAGTHQVAYPDENEKVTCANKHHQGVHPVEAVESHTRNLPLLVDLIMSRQKSPPDLIAITRGPGMKPCLSVGVSFAKALSLAWGVPLVGVHHMQAHALTPHLEAAIQRTNGIDVHVPQYPFLTLLYGSTPPPLSFIWNMWLIEVVFLLLRLVFVFLWEISGADKGNEGFLVATRCWSTQSQP